MTGLPFVLDTGSVLLSAPSLELDEGVVFEAADPAARGRHRPPLMVVAWLEESPGATLEEVVAEEIARACDVPGTALLDHEAVTLEGRPAVRSLLLQRAVDGSARAAEQWRTLADGRRWTVSATTALADQPLWGPRLARLASSLRVGAA